MRTSGSPGGHNGLKNIEEMLGSNAYSRIRLGIGNEYARGTQIDFVLGRLSEDELKQMENISVKVIEGIKTFVNQGAGKAMTMLNSKVAAKPEQ